MKKIIYLFITITLLINCNPTSTDEIKTADHTYFHVTLRVRNASTNEPIYNAHVKFVKCGAGGWTDLQGEFYAEERVEDTNNKYYYDHVRITHDDYQEKYISIPFIAEESDPDRAYTVTADVAPNN